MISELAPRVGMGSPGLIGDNVSMAMSSPYLVVLSDGQRRLLLARARRASGEHRDVLRASPTPRRGGCSGSSTTAPRTAAGPPPRGCRDAFPNARMIHLPVHASWLNQVEIYFSVVQRKLLTPDDFADLDNLAGKITAFEHRYNTRGTALRLALRPRRPQPAHRADRSMTPDELTGVTTSCTTSATSAATGQTCPRSRAGTAPAILGAGIGRHPQHRRRTRLDSNTEN